MARVARTRRGDRALRGRGTLLTSCLQAGLPVASACSGLGACGRCVVTVLMGAEQLPPCSSREAALLHREAALPDQRMACQCELPGEGTELVITTGYW